MSLSVHRFFVPDSLQNYNHLVIAGPSAACIDPFDWSLAQREAATLGVAITEIWITHGHADHVKGVPSDFAGPVRGHPDVTRCRITHPIKSDTEFEFDSHTVQVLTTPGHTFDHLCFFLPDVPAVLVGDTLFNAGVGNTRSGDVDTLYQSIEKLSQLPNDTEVYNGHDYMPTNVAFTESVIGQTPVTNHWRLACERSTPATRPITTLAEEKELNLFLRTTETETAKLVGLAAPAAALEVFRELRQRRDQW